MAGRTMMVLLDTCALLWLVGDQSQLTEHAKKVIEKHAGNIYISAISAFEISIKYNKGLLGLPIPPLEWFPQALDWHGITELSVDSSIAIQSANLPKIHQDPADRIIIATAIENKLAVITSDKHIHQYSEQTSLKTIWK